MCVVLVLLRLLVRLILLLSLIFAMLCYVMFGVVCGGCGCKCCCGCVWCWCIGVLAVLCCVLIVFVCWRVGVCVDCVYRVVCT